MAITREIAWWYHVLASTAYSNFTGYMSKFASFLIKIGVASLEKAQYHTEKL